MNTIHEPNFSSTNNANVPSAPPEAHQKACAKTEDQNQTQDVIEEYTLVEAQNKIKQILTKLRLFMPRMQFNVIAMYINDEEEDKWFFEKMMSLVELIENMPITYAQRDKDDDAIAYLHYFYGGSHWYITEKDIEGGIDQAFGYAILNNDYEMGEYGYISIAEITKVGARLDLHFFPTTLAEIINFHRR